MSLPWLAARIFLLTTQRITQHIYWNVFVQYNLIWGLGMGWPMAVYCQVFVEDDEFPPTRRLVRRANQVDSLLNE
jgi:hypothetical protein